MLFFLRALSIVFTLLFSVSAATAQSTSPAWSHDPEWECVGDCSCQGERESVLFLVEFTQRDSEGTLEEAISTACESLCWSEGYFENSYADPFPFCFSDLSQWASGNVGRADYGGSRGWTDGSGSLAD